MRCNESLKHMDGWEFNLEGIWRVDRSLLRGHMLKEGGGPLNKNNDAGIVAKSGNTLCISSKITLPRTKLIFEYV